MCLKYLNLLADFDFLYLGVTAVYLLACGVFLVCPDSYIVGFTFFQVFNGIACLAGGLFVIR